MGKHSRRANKGIIIITIIVILVIIAITTFLFKKNQKSILVKIFFRILQIQRNRSGGYRWNFFLQQF